MLDDYDHRKINMPSGMVSDSQITYEECKKIINKLKYSNLFAVERNGV